MSARGLAVGLGAAAVYLALAAAAQPDLLAHGGRDVYAQAMLGNDCLLHAWTLAWDQHALATAPCRVFDANIFFPHPRTLLYSDHLLGLAALAAPLRLATDDALLVHNLLTVAAPALDALALFALALDLTGSVAAAAVGGLLFGFAPMRFEYDRCQLQMLAAWWLPLLFLCGRRAIESGRATWAAAAGLVLALQGLTGIYLTAFVLPFVALAHVAWWRRPGRGRRALLVAEGVAVLALLPSALAYRRVQHDLGLARSPALNALFSLQPTSLATSLPLVTLGVLTAIGLLARRAAPARFRAERPLLVAVTLGALVLALGPVMPVSHRFGTVWGPYRLLLGLPGYTALRVPARLVHVALLGASTLAAGGVAALVAGRPRRIAAAIGAALLLAAGVESWPPRYATAAVVPPAEASPVYPWLARQPPAMHVVELPLDDFAFLTIVYQYASTVHWRQTLVGNSGILPPAYPYVVRELGRFPDADVLADLRALDVTDAVVHTGHLTDDVRARLDASHDLKPRFRARDAVVYAIRPALRPRRLVPAGPALARDGWRAWATEDDADAARAIDADPASAWSSWGALDRAVIEGWWNPEPFLARWQRFLDTQPARLTVDLGRVVTASAVAVRLGGSEPLALPTIALEGSLDGAEWHPLAGGLRPLPDIRALVDDAAAARLGAVLPAPERLRFVRLSASGYEWHVGDVEVHGE